MTKQTGTSSRIVRRKELKPTEELSDQQLLRQAMREAEKWQKKKAKGFIHD